MTTSETARVNDTPSRLDRSGLGAWPLHREHRFRPAADLYGQALLSRASGEPDLWRSWRVRDAGGRLTALDRALDRWLGPIDDGDRSVLQRCTGPALDLGCGPGRLVTALTESGLDALGIDVSAAAVALTRQRGAAALHADVFDPLPGEGAWNSLLLLDGNIGIGGEPASLLNRCRQLLAPGGTVLIELAPPGQSRGTLRLRLENDQEAGAWFPWASLSVDDATICASRAALRPREIWSKGWRWFAALTG